MVFHRNAFASVYASSRLQMDNTRNVPNEGYDLDSLAILRIVRQFIYVVTVAILTFALRLNLEMSKIKKLKRYLVLSCHGSFSVGQMWKRETFTKNFLSENPQLYTTSHLLFNSLHLAVHVYVSFSCLTFSQSVCTHSARV